MKFATQARKYWLHVWAQPGPFRVALAATKGLEPKWLRVSVCLCLCVCVSVCLCVCVSVWYGMVWHGMVWYGMYVCMYTHIFSGSSPFLPL